MIDSRKARIELLRHVEDVEDARPGVYETGFKWLGIEVTEKPNTYVTQKCVGFWLVTSLYMYMLYIHELARDFSCMYARVEKKAE
ncbi:hypothetical protein RJZ57_001575 [Blastomyces gilchristii]